MLQHQTEGRHGVAIRANGNRQDIGNATNMDKTFKGSACWETKEYGVLAYGCRQRKRAVI